MNIANFNFTGPATGSLCGDFGGDPLAGSGVPPTSVNRGQCSSGFSVSNVTKDGTSSCVQGAFGGARAGACVGGQDSRSFSGTDGDVTSFQVNFGAGDQGVLSSFSFFERAVTSNENFGQNFPPSLYGIEIVRDGRVIFREDDIRTTRQWTQESFDFANNPAFEFSGRTTFEIRLLGYAPSENRRDDDQNIWEIDEFNVYACCGTTSSSSTEEFTCTQTITIVDNEQPQISNVPGDLTVTCIDDVPAVSDDVVASDNCAFTTSFTEDVDPEGETCNLTITRTWTATDDCGNEVSETQVITVATDIEAAIIAEDTNVCIDETVTLEAVGSQGCGEAVDDYTYAWTGPNGFTSSERIIEVSDLGTYAVEITDSAGCSDTEEVTLDDELCMSIGSTVFVDNNNNGIQDLDDGDVGIAGVTVELWMDGALVGTTTTDADGNYFFGGLEPGDYIVEILAEGNMGPGEPLENFHRSSDPTDTADNQQDGDDNGIQEGGITSDVSSPVITLSPGTEPTGGAESAQGGDQDDFQDANGDMTIDFGFVPELSIGSTVFVDNNNNGIQDLDDGDVGIAGVTLELWMGGNLIATTTTDADGNYFFGWLAPGDYVVEILAEDNFESGQPLEQFHRSSDPTETADNQEDGDDNGMQPGGLGTDVSSPVITLSAGDEPTGTTESGQGGAQDDNLDSNGDMTVDFGFIPEFSIGSNVFVDNNDNGIRDPEDEGIEGVLVEVFNTGADGIAENADDQLVGSDVTDANGDYFVGWLRPGDFYAVIAEPSEEFPRSSGPTNLTPDEDLDNDDNGIQDAPGDGVWSNVITLSANDEPTDEPGSGGDQDDALDDDNGNMTLDFGFTPELSIGSTVFVDNNDNGIQDPDDEGIEGVTIEVFSVGPDGIPENGDDVLVGTDITDANGDYFVDGLAPGDYYVAIPTPSEDFPISSTGFGANPNDDVDEDDNGIQDAPGEGVWSNVITLLGGTEPTDEPGSGGDQDAADDDNGNMTVDFGFIPELSVGSTVFADNNDNGIQDPEDDGIEGVTVEVFSVGPDGIPENADDVLVGTDVTDANGDYFVGGLAPGDYYVAIPNVDEDFPISSTGFGANPNDDVDNDDNGIQDAPGAGVWSNVITLIGGTEPTDEPGSGGDQDAADDDNGNMTVDFGFIPELLSLIHV